MCRFRRCALLLPFMAAAVAFAGEDPSTPAVLKARQEYDAAVKKAQADLDSARTTYLARLDAAVKLAMQAGDLDEANRIDALRKSLRGPAAAGVSGAAAPTGVSVSANANANANTGANTPKPEATPESRKKPGWIVGRITDAAGKPIKGVTFEVATFGTTIKGGERSSFTLDVADDGTFAQELPDGLYATTAYLTKDFNCSRFRIQLHSVDEKSDQTKLPSKPGLVKDFVWKLAGTKPGGDPKMTFAHHGSYIRLYDSQYLAEDPDKLLSKFPADTQAVVTLTPKGPLIDGSKGSPIEIKAPLKTIGNTLGHVAMDIPIGSYTVEAKALSADGKSTPLNCSTEFRGPFKPKTEFTYAQPGIYDDITKVSIYLNP